MLTIKETMNNINLPPKENRLRLGYTKLTTQILLNRYKDKTIEEINKLLNKDFYFNNISTPTILKCSDFLKNLIFNSTEKILLITDYDADGISSAVIGERLLRMVLPKERFTVVVNKRKFGNGISKELLDTIPEINTYNVLITADHGSSNEEIFKYLKTINNNLKIIVTDHHTFKDDNFPESANYFINNQLFFQRHEEEWEILKDASGCLMFFTLLYHTLKDKITSEDFAINAYPFLAITAISDVMSMDSDLNRHLVTSGLRVMNDSRSILFRTIKAYNVSEPLYSADTVKYFLSPLINTGNRQHCEEVVFKLLISDTPKEITELLNEVMIKNNDRKKMTNKFTSAILKSDKLKGEYGKTITIKTDMGINGIIASKIGEIEQLPTICFLEHDGVYHGSARSILPNINIIDILDKLNNDGLILKYGGHRDAAGCSVDASNIDMFREKFDKYVKEALELSPLDMTVIEVFRKLEPREINPNNIINLQHLEPTGKNFPDPVFYSELTINNLFSSETMTFINFEETGPSIKGVAFHNGRYDREKVFIKGNKIGIVFTMKLSYFKSTYQCNLNIITATDLLSGE